jgi:SAM-dependent methyltransferase
LLAALFHIVVGAMALFSLYLLAPEKIKRALSVKVNRQTAGLDFGWSFAWMNGYAIAGTICLTLALLLFIQFESSWWQILPVLLVLLAVNLFAGNLFMRKSKALDYMTLPFVDLFSSDHDLILDAGSGAGRTTLALNKVMKSGRIIALDRFDADYIQGGGKTLLERNLKVAGITDKVQIAKGDITQLEFEDAKFDTVVSSYMIDHLGKLKLPALKEVARVLKPGGKFLMIVFEPNFMTFAMANLLYLLMPSRNSWRELFQQAGLSLLEEGAINGGVFFLLKK